MRWQRLFGDLETQFDRETDLERRDELRDQLRRRLADMSLVDVLHRAGVSGEAVTIITTESRVHGSLRETGIDWIALNVHGDGVVIVRAEVLECVVDSASTLVDGCTSGDGESASGDDGLPGGRGVDASGGLASEAAPHRPSVVPLTFDQMLGRLARRRVPVSLHLSGRRVSGTLRAVGRDWVELHERRRTQSRASSAATPVSLVAMSGISAITLWIGDAPPRW